MTHKKLIHYGVLPFLLLGSIFFFSCKEDDPTKPKGSKEFSMSMQSNFEQTPLKNLLNVQVKDFLLYNVSLKYSTDGSIAKYVFKLNSKDTDRHERLGKDYRAYFMKAFSYDSIMTSNKRALLAGTADKAALFSAHNLLKGDSAIVAKEMQYVLIVEPLLPGTFKHTYEFKKHMKDSVATVKEENNFNCVEIKAWWQEHKRKTSTYFRNDFYFQVNDGENTYDHYLTPSAENAIKYSITYDGVEYKGNDFDENRHQVYAINTPLFFFKSKEDKERRPPVTVRNVSRLKFEKKMNVGTKNEQVLVIEYFNIPLFEK